MVLIKICGITSIDDAEACLGFGVDVIGINLVPESPRAVNVSEARRIADHVGERARLVLVVANRSAGELRGLRERTGIDWLQLHGDEPAELVESVLPHAYKAVRIGGAEDVENARRQPGDWLLVDAKVPGQLGGTGKTPPLELVEPLARERKLILAGGLHPDNVADAIATVRPFGVDVASGVEHPGEPRRKDPARIEAFVRAVRSESSLDNAKSGR